MNERLEDFIQLYLNIQDFRDVTPCCLVNSLILKVKASKKSLFRVLDPEDEGITNLRSVSNYQLIRRNVPEVLYLQVEQRLGSIMCRTVTAIGH